MLPYAENGRLDARLKVVGLDLPQRILRWGKRAFLPPRTASPTVLQIGRHDALPAADRGGAAVALEVVRELGQHRTVEDRAAVRAEDVLAVQLSGEGRHEPLV